MKRSKLLLTGLIVVAIVAFFASGLQHQFTLANFKAQQAHFSELNHTHPVVTAGVFFILYVLVTALSLPGAAIMTLVGGALFGLLEGFLLVSFASSLGATLAFLASRFLLKDWVQSRFGERLKAINQGVEKEGGFYLFTLRLVPAFPFFVINLVMGLTPIKPFTFYWVSQLGMLAGTFVYVNAGTQLGEINTLAGVVSPGLLASFALLGLFPLIAKKALDQLKKAKVYKGFKKPKTFDRNMVVIGAGSAGLVTSYIAAAVRAKVTLVEKHRMGGDCLNTGCVPSKALIRSARFLSQIENAKSLGIRDATATFAFSEVMERVQRVVKTVEPHDSIARYNELGVDVRVGSARIVSPWAVEIEAPDGTRETLTTRNITIATGARPFVPNIPGIEHTGYYTSDTIWELREQPETLLVLGAGPIGCELAQAFSRLESKVVQIQQGDRIMPREDQEVSQYVLERFQAEGIQVLLNSEVVRFALEGDQKVAFVQTNGSSQMQKIEFDTLLVAVGRAANLTGFGLEELGIETGKTVITNEYLQTKYPNIFAAGDVAGPYQFTHTAAHQAWYAAVNGLFGQFKRFKADYSVIPWATFTDPEVARVGLNEQEAIAQGIAHEVTRYGLDDLDRAIADEAAHGWVKVLTPPGSDRILGATIVGDHAGDLIAEFVLAMRHGLGLNKILGTIHIYPTWTEANKYAAGVWKKANAPETVLKWVERFHRWQRKSK
ncbi:FAD-dependent oxidoreductase [Limnobacter litoralis]|uniref:Pyridine nucleotide-disulfide oxidoreductase n=1 Tax=Limnobacter litoralis TaxID=481366 RepID=A0ABQ5YLD9_9BURK|nr:bifunctional TVP38/TMEM64 family protein/FAD-dependent oxidoreductase [Limnobacter litoralis]GLR25370.1 pyridine nucleotide-disulfide oxidoreductase [Limnobacter litoralis]